jgi:hypothetical protein
MTNKLRDSIDPSIKFSISEGENSIVDGEHVLAEIEGEFFVPNGKSRNGRFYPESLWKKVIENKDIKKRLDDRLMFGTVGHDFDLGDAAIREGMVSHVMTEIYIDEKGKGKGKALILGTPAGKILNTVIRAGSKLAVSSRANGTFKGKKNGLPVVDEDSYELEGWDFVIDPGFLQARPSLKESLQEMINNINIESEQEGDTLMSENNSIDAKLVEHISNENADLKNKVGELTDNVTSLKESNNVLEDENKHLKGELEIKEEVETKLAAFDELGTFEQIKEALEVADKQSNVLKAFNELADTPEDAKHALEAAEKFIESVNEKFGSFGKAVELLEEVEKYRELGSSEDVKTVLEAFDARLEAEKAKEQDAIAEKLAADIGKEKEDVVALLEKYSEEDIRKLYETVNENNDNYKKKVNEDIESDVDKIDEDKDKKVNKGMSLAEKIGSNLVG